jgi:hypothetical protein
MIRVSNSKTWRGKIGPTEWRQESRNPALSRRVAAIFGGAPARFLTRTDEEKENDT